VAVGLIFAAELALRLGRIDESRVAEHRRVVAAYDLPGRLPVGIGTSALIELMARDKKALDGITFVLDGPDGVESVTGVPVALIEDAIDAIRTEGDRS
jgi:5-deoxy-5-amino-3-dehydroquinate synthase